MIRSLSVAAVVGVLALTGCGSDSNNETPAPVADSHTDSASWCADEFPELVSAVRIVAQPQQANLIRFSIDTIGYAETRRQVMQGFMESGGSVERAECAWSILDEYLGL